jgi:hypothetical protein
MWTIWRFQGDTGTLAFAASWSGGRPWAQFAYVPSPPRRGTACSRIRRQRSSVSRGFWPTTTAFRLRRIRVATMSLVALPALTKPMPVTPASVWISTIWMPPGSVRGWREALYRRTVTSVIFTGRRPGEVMPGPS